MSPLDVSPRRDDEPIIDPAERRNVLMRLGLWEDRPIPELDRMAGLVLRDVLDHLPSLAAPREAPAPLLCVINFIKDDHQYFAGWYATPEFAETIGVSVTGRHEERFMDLKDGWCVLTVERKMALPLDDVYAWARAASNGAVHKIKARAYLGAQLVDPATRVVFGTVAIVSQTQIPWETPGVELIKRHARRISHAICSPPDGSSATAPERP
jgi:hypothetical protein